MFAPSLLRAVILVLVALFATASAAGCATLGAQSGSKSAHTSKKKRATKKPKKPAAVADNNGTGDDDDEGDANDTGEDGGDGELTAVASEGAASYYHDSLAGRLTASGEKYNPEAATCAHRTLPFGTVLVIENVQTGKKSHCKVNDRGPYVDGRLLDVSKRVARELGMLNSGVIRVRIRVAKQPAAS